MSEETRAIEYRRKMSARAEWECAQRFSAFPGDSARRTALTAAWDPWVNPLKDWDPVDCGAVPNPVPTPMGPHVRGGGLQLA